MVGSLYRSYVIFRFYFVLNIYKYFHFTNLTVKNTMGLRQNYAKFKKLFYGPNTVQEKKIVFRFLEI